LYQDCWRQLGQCHAENESESQAIAALLKAVEFDPYNLEALLLLSVSYTNDLEHSRALGFLKAWLQHHPDYQQIAQGALLLSNR
jgi:peroxin-5